MGKVKKVLKKKPFHQFDHKQLADPEVKPGRNTVVNGKGYFVRPMNRQMFDENMTRIFGPTKLDLALAKERAGNRLCNRCARCRLEGGTN